MHYYIHVAYYNLNYLNHTCKRKCKKQVIVYGYTLSISPPRGIVSYLSVGTAVQATLWEVPADT